MHKIRGKQFTKTIIISFLVAALFAAFSSTTAIAGGGGGWSSGSEGGPSGGSTGGSNHNCGSYPGNTYLQNCTGVSWLTFNFTGLVPQGTATQFEPYGGAISGDCAYPERQLYHFGWNASSLSYGGISYFSDFDNVLGLDDKTGAYAYTSFGNSKYADQRYWGHMATFNRLNKGGPQPGSVSNYQSHSPLSHNLFINGTAIYWAANEPSDEEAFKAYQEYYVWANKKTNPNVKKPTEWGSVSMFCYWPGMNSSTSFDGKITVTPSSGKLTESVKSIKLTWSSVLTRGDGGDIEEPIAAYYKIEDGSPTYSTKLAKGASTGSIPSGTMTVTSPGTYCKTLHWAPEYNEETKQYSEMTGQYTACATITQDTPPPPPDPIPGTACNQPKIKIQAKAGSGTFNSGGSGQGYSPTNPYPINKDEEQISFQHTAVIPSFYCPRGYQYGTASSTTMSWQTFNIVHRDSYGRDTTFSSGSLQARSGSKSVSSGAGNVVFVPHSTENAKERYLNDEIKEYCEESQISYSYMDHWYNNYYCGKYWCPPYYNYQTRTNSANAKGKLCIYVQYKNNDPDTPSTDPGPEPKYSSSKCNVFDKVFENYGVFSGKNVGGTRVTRNVGASRNKKEVVYSSDSNEVKSVWTKPGDTAMFEESMCEGAELANQYWIKNVPITYNVVDFITNGYGWAQSNRTGKPTNNKEYLNSKMKSKNTWNNNGIINLQAALSYRDIFGNSGDKKKVYKDYEASSARTTGYQITNQKHVGKCIGHTLTFSSVTASGGKFLTAPTLTTAADTQKSSQACTPFNYIMDSEIARDGGSAYVYPGQTGVRVTATVKIRGRKNSIVDESASYQTRTKPTSVRFISFVIGNGVTSSNPISINHVVSGSTWTNLASMCNSFITVKGSDGPYHCYQFYNYSNNGYSESTTSSDHGAYFSVPDDIPIGSKYCVLSAVYPADSHDLPNSENVTSTAESVQNAALTLTGGYWRVSQPTCVTVSKRPTVQVKGYGLYVEGDVNTLNSLRTGVPRDYRYDLYNERVFGSWSEYEIVAKGRVNGMASGAMYWNGYNNSISSKRNVRNECFFSSMTLTNANCGDSTKTKGTSLGGFTTSDLEGSNSHPASTVQHLKDRYTDHTFTAKTSSTLMSVSGGCEFVASAGRYVPLNTNTNQHDTNNTGKFGFYCLENGSLYAHIKGNTTLSTSSSTDWYFTREEDKMLNNTYVYEVDGTLTINASVFVTDAMNNGTPTDTKYNSINEVPRVLIFANEIKILGNVQEINAWLIANKIDTCSNIKDASGKNQGVTNCDTQLRINGPVFTKQLTLNRTYGGGGQQSGRGTALTDKQGVYQNSQAAEIFSLRPDDLIWAYGQSERYMQATTTYQRELPVRY